MLAWVAIATGFGVGLGAMVGGLCALTFAAKRHLQNPRNKQTLTDI